MTNSGVGELVKALSRDTSTDILRNLSGAGKLSKAVRCTEAELTQGVVRVWFPHICGNAYRKAAISMIRQRARSAEPGLRLTEMSARLICWTWSEGGDRREGPFCYCCGMKVNRGWSFARTLNRDRQRQVGERPVIRVQHQRRMIPQPAGVPNETGIGVLCSI